MRVFKAFFTVTACLTFLFSEPLSAQRPFPVVHDDMSQEYTTGTRPWQRPRFSEDPDRLSEDFRVPSSFRKRVDFWKQIYANFSTWQGVLHDALYPWVVYRVVDFSDIELNLDSTPAQRERARRLRVEKAKDEIVEVFKRLRSDVAEGKELSGEAFSIHRQLEGDPKALEEAGQLDRVRFQLGQRDRFLKGIYYSGRYIEEIEKIFQREGLPRELSRLPMVESSFNIFAQSRVGASGLWQIMPSVGREQKLRRDAVIDERNDPIKATQAAARILKNNYRLLEDWPLALTGYNHGVYGIRRRIQNSAATSLFDLVEERGRGSFGFASKNFFASFVAALEVELHADVHFEEVLWSRPLPQTEWELPQALSWRKLVDGFSGDEEMARIFNPHINLRARQGQIALPKGARVYVPADSLQSLADSLPQPSPIGTAGPDIYRVLPGDTLSGVAERLGYSVRQIQDLNGIEDASSLRAGQKLRLPQKK